MRINELVDKVSARKEYALIAGISAGALATYFTVRFVTKPRPAKKGPYPIASLPQNAYDAVIVGSGPSGSTAAYYMVKGGAKVALLDKEKFPRDKYCGDAVCTPAIEILNDMGLIDVFKKENECKFADAGGFVSPSGISYIGRSQKKLGRAAATAIKRTHLDTRLAHLARDSGANLMEEFEVVDADFNKDSGLWNVTSSTGSTVQARVLLCADGAPSRLATKLGYCTEAPRGVCSRAYVQGGTHNTDFDGVCFYQRESLPGYSAIFRHPNDELNYCYYLIPTDSKGACGNVREEDLARLHNNAITSDPFIAASLGPKAKVERMKAASLRLGGQGLKTTYDDHLLIIGDAAGHIDPLTGEGIHTAMMGGKAAAETLLDMRQTGDFSKTSTRMYHVRWWRAFGHDFGMSKSAAQLIYRYPLLLDACASEMRRRGDVMMSQWAEVMTGLRPKTYFLQPHIALPLGVAVVREAVEQYVFKKGDNYKEGFA